MNQIIQTPNSSIDTKSNQTYREDLYKRKSIKFFKFYLVFSLFVVFCSSIYYINRWSIINKSEKISQLILNNYDVSKLYSTSYSPSNINNQNVSFVIGILQIDKINIKYPVLSEINDELLKIAPCRFYGPLPGQAGNICIASHNYDDNRFFGRLNQLNPGDIITLYNNSRE